jgi:TonB C terminal
MMRSAVAVSTLIHGALFGAFLLTAPWHKLPAALDLSPVEIEYIDISELNRVTEAPRPSMAAAPRETTEIDADANDATSAAALGESALKSDTPPPDAKLDNKPQRMDAKKLENLIDKRLAESDRKPLDVSDLTRTIEKAIDKDTLVDQQASANLAQAVRQMVERCWNPPLGSEKLGQIWVTIRVTLRQDGSVASVPELVGHSGVKSENTAIAQALADSARRAILRCAPYVLPEEQHRLWRDLELRFDPSQMSG